LEKLFFCISLRGPFAVIKQEGIHYLTVCNLLFFRREAVQELKVSTFHGFVFSFTALSSVVNLYGLWCVTNSGAATLKSSWRDKMFDFSREAAFCLGYRLLKHKVIGYATNYGGALTPGPSWLRLWCQNRL